MAYKVNAVEGIGKAATKKLTDAGVKTVDALLERGATPKERKALAEVIGEDAAKVLAWVNLADLFRVKGVGTQYSGLLHAAGVDSVVELGKRKPENLTAKMREVNAEKKLVRQPPSEKLVANWVEQAKKMPRKINY